MSEGRALTGGPSLVATPSYPSRWPNLVDRPGLAGGAGGLE
jgi:hypothetical protein